MHSAILLSAGRGERMRPLTDYTPKPLISVRDKALIIYHIEKLSKLNIKNIIINISHLAEKIQEALGDGSHFDVKITYSYEPEALETGGGIYQALPLLGSKPFLVISSDIYTDYNFGNLIDRYKLAIDAEIDKNNLAHLILVPNPEYHPKGDYSLEKNGYLNIKPAYTYASMGIIHPKLFEGCTPGKFSVVPLLEKAIKNQQITGELYTGLWYNIGTAKELALVNNF